jgi:hypothetical protein
MVESEYARRGEHQVFTTQKGWRASNISRFMLQIRVQQEKGGQVFMAQKGWTASDISCDKSMPFSSPAGGEGVVVTGVACHLEALGWAQTS